MKNNLLIPGKVTAVITAYNSANYIVRCIESIISQKNEICDIIVVDDGSTDNTGEVLKPYLDKIHYFKQDVNRGPAVGRTIGLQNTKTEFISFLDADDYWNESFAHELKEFLSENHDVIAITSGYIKKDYRGFDLNRPVLEKNDELYYENGNICPNFYEFFEKYKLSLNGTMMRTDVALKTGGQREDLRLTQDLEFFCFLATFGKWAIMPKQLFISDEQILKPNERLKKFDRRFSFFRTINIENWTKRIAPALIDTRSIVAFSKYQNHIITLIAVAKAYTFDFKGSFQYIKENKNKIKNIGWGKGLLIGIKLGRYLWPFVCIGLKCREIVKTYFSLLKNKFRIK